MKTTLMRVTSAPKMGAKRGRSGTMKAYTRRRPQSSIPRSVTSPMTYKFQQTFADSIQLNTAIPPTGWSAQGNALVRQMTFSLDELPTYTRFSNLFAQYRLLAVKTEMFFGNTVSDTLDTGTSNSGNRQMLVYTMPNRAGVAETLTEDAFLQTQAHKKQLALKTDGKPTVCYQDLSQLSQVFHTGVNTDYAKMSPKFISTGESGTPHYGLDIRIQRVDGEEFSQSTATYPFVKLLHTVYFECRQVN